uniref:ATP synthase protein 8 n=1 Tax=Orbilia oligospora TaxID=2813651 RepID=A0A481ZKP0_ORBOL|nr:ATP synthase F0 subunit 8 [Orbilia oligospora]QBL02012.1 ATP synthase F0 subunit 8 [Orbilia oligospora]QID02767.1 ATP synthase F0 subunit 8 [Orbilia oligospora]QID02835.1 ATP synthase F0 subunit 8 [Orbilia oligospora]QID02877.1 ATP synthase F0 subunit 8 [Orbilia oligospora]QIJ59995.1 ATP synthase F0 subunit 8 [Orbilia oligospora]
MPQLVPFYFINQVTYVFLILLILIYTFSKFVLPHIVRTLITRTYLNII